MPTTNKPPVLILSQLPPPYSGLANNMELYLSSSLARAYDITCLNLSPGLNREKDPDKPSVITALHGIKVVFRLLYILATESPQLIYAKAGTKWGFIRDLSIMLICKIFRKRFVCHLHSKSSGTLFLDNHLLRNIFRFVMGLPDKVVVLSDSLKEDFARLIKPEKLVAIENIVNTAFFTDTNSESDNYNPTFDRCDAIKVLFVGRLSKSKGAWDLLKVIPFIVKDHKNVVFVLAGVGENEQDEKRIYECCRQPPLTEHVRLLGTIRGQQKSRTFTSADIFVLPTYNDNMPNVILEAMSAGLPIIGTNVGQIPYMIKNNINGFIIEPGDLNSLQAKLLLLITSRDLREQIGQTNYCEARSKYDIEIGAEKMKQVFESLIREGGR